MSLSGSPESVPQAATFAGLPAVAGACSVGGKFGEVVALRGPLHLLDCFVEFLRRYKHLALEIHFPRLIRFNVRVSH